MEPIREKLFKDKKKFHVGTGALVDLKAALFQKQQELKKHKKSTNDSAPVSTKHVSDKTAAIWRNVTGAGGRKDKRKLAETDKQERARELSLEEERELEKSRKALVAKAALYEKLSRGEGLRKEEEEEEEEGEERYLVDFTKKLAEEHIPHRVSSATATRDDDNGGEDTGGGGGGEEEEYEAQNSDDEWVEYEDSFGRTRRCLRKDLPTMKELDSKLKERSPTPDLLSDDMQRERERRRWEQEALEGGEEERPVGPTHYQELQQGEIRSHGIGYYAFSAEEEKRTEQIGLLNKLREQTVQQRDKRQKLQEKRKAVLEARLAKVRERKLKQKGSSGEGEGGGGGGGGGVDIADFDFEKKESSNEGGEGESVDVSAMINSELLKAREIAEKKEEEKRAQHVRAWDRGKVVDPIRKRKQELHDERLEEFAPPSLYNNFKKAKPSCIEQDGTPNVTPTNKDDTPLPTSDPNPSQSSTPQAVYPSMPPPPFPYPYSNCPYPVFYPPPPPHMQHSFPYPPPPPPPPHVFPPHMYPPPPPPIQPEHPPNPQPPWDKSGSLGAND